MYKDGRKERSITVEISFELTREMKRIVDELYAQDREDLPWGIVRGPIGACSWEAEYYYLEASVLYTRVDKKLRKEIERIGLERRDILRLRTK